MGKPLYIFDFDGVIADSLSLCLQACEYAASQYGCQLRLERDCWEFLDEVTFEAMARSLGFEDEMVEGFAGHVFAYNRRPRHHRCLPEWARHCRSCPPVVNWWWCRPITAG